jgi:hypothetical protein
LSATGNLCGPYTPRGPEKRDHIGWRGIVLLKRADGTDRNSPRDLPGYDGRGASKALLLAIERAAASPTCGSGRLYALHSMALEMVEREQAREHMEVA